MSHPLLAQAQQTGAPVIAGAEATLLWQGGQPPLLVGDFNFWNPARPAPWTKLAGDLWAHSLALPADAYMEYAFLAEPKDSARVPDPLNPRTTPNGIGHTNHYFYMPAGGPTPLAQRVRGVQRGRVTPHLLQTGPLTASGKRQVWLYRPAAAGPYPLLVVYDGRDYLRRGRLPEIVDNLIAQGRIRPVALALADHGGPARGVEYAGSEATVGFVVERLLPLAQRELDLLDPLAADAGFGVMGASAGGLMALFTALRAPHVFRRVLSQSGAFGWEGGHKPFVFDLAQYLPVRPLRIWLDCGLYEGLLPGNRDMYDLLTRRGYDAQYREYPAGHNYPAWRDDLWRGLEALYPAS